MTHLALEAIVVGDRVRKDLGDLQRLADSIQRHGLLHPVVVTPDSRLIAGVRRLEAVRMLGWTEVPVTIINVADLLVAEQDFFTPTRIYRVRRRGRCHEPQ